MPLTQKLVLVYRYSKKYNFTYKGLNGRTLEVFGHGTMTKHRKVLEESLNVTSTNGGLPTLQHIVGTYIGTNEQVVFRLHPKSFVEKYG